MKKSSDKTTDIFSILIAALLIVGLCIGDNAEKISCTAASLMFRSDNTAEITVKPEKTEPVTDLPKQQNKDASREIDLLTTCADIIETIKKYSVNDKEGEVKGKIRSVTYGENGATDTYENIRARNNTKTKKLNIKSLVSQPLDLNIDRSKPAVLIFHSHTSEAYELEEKANYYDYETFRSNNESLNIVRVGTEIKNYLEKFGYTVIHDKTIHDDDYNGSYPHSRKSIEKILKDNPQIKIVLDIHRDSIDLENDVKIRPVCVINGKKAAQMMIIAGTQEGKITDFPDWEENLKFALRLQGKCEEMFPGSMRPLLFTQKKYNMDITRFSLLIEMGSEVNTLEEACYSARLLAAALASFMDEYSEQEIK